MSTNSVHDYANQDRSNVVKNSAYKSPSHTVKKFSPERGFAINEKTILLGKMTVIIVAVTLIIAWPLFGVLQWTWPYVAMFVLLEMLVLASSLLVPAKIYTSSAHWVGVKDVRMVRLYNALNCSFYDEKEKGQIAALLAGKTRAHVGTQANTTKLRTTTRAILIQYFAEKAKLCQQTQALDIPVDLHAEFQVIARLDAALTHFQHSEAIDDKLQASITRLEKESQRQQNVIITDTALEIARLQEEAYAKKQADADELKL